MSIADRKRLGMSLLVLGSTTQACAIAIGAMAAMPLVVFAQASEPEAEIASAAEAPVVVGPEESATAESSQVEEATAADAEPVPVIPVVAIKVEPTPAPVARGAVQLEEIVVTATKREKSARDIPVTVNAHSGDELMQKGVSDLEQIVIQQPGVTLNGGHIVMRGVATSALGSYATSEEVGRFLGEISLSAPAGRGSLPDLDPFDMQSIEVAKGPQGTLFGGTALAGAVRYIPNKPDTTSSSAIVRGAVGMVSHAEDLQPEANLMLNGAFDDTFGIRLAGSFRNRPGVIDDLHGNKADIDTRDARQWRALATWAPNSDFTLDFTYFHWQEDKGDLGFTDNVDRYETDALRSPQPISLSNDLYNVRAEYGFDSFSIVASVSQMESTFYNIADLTGPLGVGYLPATAVLDVHTRSPETRNYELRVVSRDPTESSWWVLRDWDYLIGVFKLDTTTDINSKVRAGPGLPSLPLPFPLPIVIPNQPIVTALDQQFNAEAHEDAVFFDLTRGLFDRKIEINLGGRYARSTLDGVTFIQLAGLEVNPVQAGTDEHRFNPKVAVTWRYSSNFSIYGSAAQGYRFGGFNANPTSGILLPRTFKSDSLWNYEIGLRTDWLDRTLRLDVTGFRIDWDDIQSQLVSPAAENYSDNAGNARILGADAALRWNLPSGTFIPEGLSVALSGSYTDARITEDFDSPDGTVPAGSRLPLTPYLLANASVSWNSAFGDWLTGATLSDSYSGDRKNQLFETKHMPAFHIVSASVSASNPSARMRPALSLSATNLLNEHAPYFAFAARTGPDVLYGLSRPRTILLSVQLSFDAN